MDAVGNIFEQIDAIDLGSIAFRYPDTKYGVPSLPDDLKYVNIRNLAEMMQCTGSFLEGVDIMASNALEHKLEMEAFFYY